MLANRIHALTLPKLLLVLGCIIVFAFAWISCVFYSRIRNLSRTSVNRKDYKYFQLLFDVIKLRASMGPNKVYASNGFDFSTYFYEVSMDQRDQKKFGFSPGDEENQ